MVSDAIVARLREAGVRAIFGMPGGGSNLDLIDAAVRAGVPFVLTATETGGAIAAAAQGELTGCPGACVTTLGPGVASVVNGVACAFLDRMPLVVMTDSYPASGDGFEHQRLDHRALLGSITKGSFTIGDRGVDAAMLDAIARALAPPPGPVHIDLEPAVARPRSQVPGTVVSPAGLETSLGPATWDLGLFGSARCPLLMIGLGARQPADVAAIRAFCARHAIPAMVTYKAKGVIADDDPHFAGVFTNAVVEQAIVRDADLILGVGLDPVELLPRPWTYTAPVVNCSRWPAADRHLPFCAQFIGDIATTIGRIAEVVGPVEWDLDRIRRLVREQRDRICVPSERLTPDQVVRVSAGVAGPDARVTVDAGAHMIPATMLWPVAGANGMLISNGLSTMGFALPAAIGAALLDRSRPVVALTGDGGLLICAGELATAARERLRIVTIVFADRSLSLIRVKQAQRYFADVGMTIGDVDWCALAESLGVAASAAETEQGLERAVAAALAHDGPSLVEARIDPATYADTLRAVRG